MHCSALVEVSVGVGVRSWLRVNNVFDEDYEAVAGYPAPDLHFYGGITKPL